MTVAFALVLLFLTVSASPAPALAGVLIFSAAAIVLLVFLAVEHAVHRRTGNPPGER